MLEIFEGLLYTVFILGGFLYIAFGLGKDNERNAKLDKEDRILHELTACRED